MTLYTALLVASLWTNGVVTVAQRSLPELFRPLRNRRLIGGALTIDVLLVPVTVLTCAWLLPGISDGMRVGLVLIAAASTGPIGAVFTRIVRGDLPLAVSLVTAFGALNLVTVPLIGALLLRHTVTVPLVAVMTSMLLLVVLPLGAGAAWRRVNSARRVPAARVARQMRVLSLVSTVTLVGALLVALTVDFGEMLQLLAGPVGVLAFAVTVMVSIAAYGVGDTAVRRVTLAIVLNARGGGLALTVAALHFAHIGEVRATVVTVAVVMQALPTALVMLHSRFATAPVGGPAAA